MSLRAVLTPVFLQVALTFVLLFALGRLRIGAIRRGEVKLRDVALREKGWPARISQVENAFRNQLELPILFYAAVLVGIVSRTADMAFVVLAWLFVATRLVHAHIHTSSNNVRHRFHAFTAGVSLLLLMWLLVAARVLLASV